MCIIQFIYIYIYVYYMKETIQKVQFCIIKIYCFKFYYMYNGFINACIKAKPFSFSIDALNYIFIYATDLFSYNFSIYVWVFLIVNSYIHKSKYNIDDFFLLLHRYFGISLYYDCIKFIRQFEFYALEPHKNIL